MKTANYRSVLMAIYCVAGALVSIVNLAQADLTHRDDFLCYLLCGALAALGLRSSHRNVIPLSLLVMLPAIQDLTLSQLIVIALAVSLLGLIREARRTRPGVWAICLSVASGSIGIAAAQMIHQAFAALKYNALFPAPFIASSLILLLNLSLTRMIEKKGSFSVGTMLLQEVRPLLPWFVGLAYLASSDPKRGHPERNECGPGNIADAICPGRGVPGVVRYKDKHREELAALQKRSLEKSGRAASAHSGDPGGRHQRPRSHDSDASAPGPILCPGGGNGIETHRGAAGAPECCRPVTRYRQTGDSRPHPAQAGALIARRVGKDENPPRGGAEMLARMNFPEQVLEIVATHHEKWDGKGYPRGIKGEQIPIGARILSAVDCLDALASDRPYRGALTIEMAMDRVSKEEGRSLRSSGGIRTPAPICGAGAHGLGRGDEQLQRDRPRDVQQRSWKTVRYFECRVQARRAIRFWTRSSPHGRKRSGCRRWRLL